MLIYARNEHSDMQANKLNAKYHLHVQHSTNATMQGNAQHLPTSTRLQSKGT